MTDNEFEEVLNDTFPDVQICGQMFNAGYALRKLDIISFNLAKNKFEDTDDS